VKTKRLQWAEHAAQMEDRKYQQNFGVEISRKTYNWKTTKEMKQ
jgi:hypothetical protein